MKKKSFYVTTPIYYVNDAPHIGHAYTSTLADVLTRFHKMIGDETFFLTGTDEHGQKVQQAAAKRGVDPQEHVDTFNVRFKDLWKQMGIDYDFFIRTTDEDHKVFVRECLQKLWDKGEIYAKEYQGWYSVGEERFFSEEELVDGKDPISGRPVEWLMEKNYFFRMGKYQQQLISYIENNPNWILPDFRKNEVLGFLRQPLNDLCISRPKARLSWGIPLPFDPDFVTYVWFDALINYVSAVRNRKHASGTPVWPATMHLIGKDILTTHSIYWPTMLMALEIELPKHLLAHGWWMNGGAKMSKSTGNVVNPAPYMEQYGVDTFRYFLIREMVVGLDSTFSDDAFIRRSNSDLANDLGNGLNRVHRLVLTNFEGILPSCKTWGSEEEELKTLAIKVIAQVIEWVPQVKLSQIVEEIMTLVRAVNRYLEVKAPWKLAKDESKRDEFSTVLWVTAEALRVAFTLLSPVIPSKAREGLAMLGTSLQGAGDLKWGILQGGEVFSVGPGGQGLFPRIEVEKIPGAENTASVAKPQNAQLKPLTADQIPAAVDFRVAKILSVENHPDAESLFVLKVDAGESEPRTVCAGLRKSYTASDLFGKSVLLFANLKPAPLRGIMSQGMLLAGDGLEGKAVLVEVGDAKVGTRAEFSGLAPLAETRELKLKDFEKITLSVAHGNVVCNTMSLSVTGKPVTCSVAEGAGVH
jgi:methionyl-tRNA synthetase